MPTLSIRAALLACALLLPCSVMSQPVKDPVNLGVIAFHAEGVVRVNGVPMHYFKHVGPKVVELERRGGGDKIRIEDSSHRWSDTNYLFFCVNGDNKITVEAKITDAEGSVQMTLEKSPNGPNLFEQKLTTGGTISYTLAQSGLPEWAWVKADAVTDGKSELLKAVAAYQQAFAKKDIATIDAFKKPSTEVMRKAMAMSPQAFQEEMKRLADMVRESKLLPLPAVNALDVEGSLGGRVYAVTGKDHDAPVVLQFPPPFSELTLEFGQYWTRIAGKWDFAGGL